MCPLNGSSSIAGPRNAGLSKTFLGTHRSRVGLIFKGLDFVGDVRASAGQQREDFYRRQVFGDRQAAYQTAGGPFSSRPTF